MPILSYKLNQTFRHEFFVTRSKETPDVSPKLTPGQRPSRVQKFGVFLGQNGRNDGPRMGPLVEELVQDPAVRMLGGKGRPQHLDAHRCHFPNDGRVVAEPPAAIQVQVPKLGGQDARLVLVGPRQKRRQKPNPRKPRTQARQYPRVGKGYDSVPGLAETRIDLPVGPDLEGDREVPFLADLHQHVTQKVAVFVDDAGQLVDGTALAALGIDVGKGGNGCKGKRLLHGLLVDSCFLAGVDRLGGSLVLGQHKIVGGRRHDVLRLHRVAPVAQELPGSLQGGLVPGRGEGILHDPSVSGQERIDPAGRSKMRGVLLRGRPPVACFVGFEGDVGHDRVLDSGPLKD
mmetsp:Transcript_5074/g.12450  ORF Transcript_5074/g.12450 Transcript_5074/m.12450 type:complete len:344 (-) Transcript_5074:527-1558(-)